MDRFKVISFGLGPIGQAIARLALSSRTSRMEIVEAVDIDPNLQGKDLGEVLGLGKKIGVRVKKNLDLARADVALHATSSFLSVAMPQLLELCNAGLDVISTNEELSYPWFSHKKEGRKLDDCAMKNGVTVLGTGVNPGFVLDALVITLSGVCARISKVRTERVLDATMRRLPFQQKVGIGLSIAQFQSKLEEGKFGHIGLPESIAMVCDALGKPVERVEQNIQPKVAEQEVRTEHFGTVARGRVLGLVQNGVGFADGDKEVARYHLEMYAGAKDPHDSIELVGEPNISISIPNGTPGDIATSAIVLNSIGRVVRAKPGLFSVKDLAPAAGTFSF